MSRNSPTLIGNIFSNITDNEAVSGNVLTKVTDNFPQVLIIKKAGISCENVSIINMISLNSRKITSWQTLRVLTLPTYMIIPWMSIVNSTEYSPALMI